MSVPVKLSCGCMRNATEKAAKSAQVYCRFHGSVSVVSAQFDEWHAVCVDCRWGRWGSYGSCSYEAGKHYRNKRHRVFVGRDRHPGTIRRSREYLGFVASTEGRTVPMSTVEELPPPF